MNNLIRRVPDYQYKKYSCNVGWDEHRKTYTLLHCMRPQIKQVRGENIDLKEKIKRLKKDLKMKNTELENFKRGMSHKRGSLRNGKKRKIVVRS